MTNVDNKVNNYFRTIISSSLNRNYYYTQLSSLLSTLTNYANGVSSEATDCCQYKKKGIWPFRKTYCATHNSQRPNQLAEKNYFEALKNEISQMSDKIMRDVHTFMYKTSQILSNSSMGIIEKINKI